MFPQPPPHKLQPTSLNQPAFTTSSILGFPATEHPYEQSSSAQTNHFGPLSHIAYRARSIVRHSAACNGCPANTSAAPCPSRTPHPPTRSKQPSQNGSQQSIHPTTRTMAPSYAGSKIYLTMRPNASQSTSPWPSSPPAVSATRPGQLSSSATVHPSSTPSGRSSSKSSPRTASQNSHSPISPSTRESLSKMSQAQHHCNPARIT